MTLQNRVDPWGRLQAIEVRGAWLGNRGILHDDQKRIVAPWRHKAWVTFSIVNAIRAGLVPQVHASAGLSRLRFESSGLLVSVGGTGHDIIN